MYITLVTEQASYMLVNVSLSDSYSILQDGSLLTDDLISKMKEEVNGKLSQFFSAPDSFYLPQLTL